MCRPFSRAKSSAPAKSCEEFGGTKACNLTPSNSPTEYPCMAANVGFMSTIESSESTTNIPKPAPEKICFHRSSSRSAILRAVTSLNTRTTPSTLSAASRMGALLSSIDISIPAFETRRPCCDKLSPATFRCTALKGFSSTFLVSSSTIWNTSFNGSFSASFAGQPVSLSATGIHKP